MLVLARSNVMTQNIREVYNFLCANYAEGDDIILTGFSRGAFTARSVADMIGSLGLLTPEGLDNFYAISHDYEDIGDENRDPGDYLCPTLAAYEGQKGQARISWEDDRLATYTNWLKEASSQNPLVGKPSSDFDGYRNNTRKRRLTTARRKSK